MNYIKIKVNDNIFNYFKDNKKAHEKTFKHDINGFYIILENEKKETTIINYDSFLILDNKKLNSIYINFSTSKDCPSMKKGLCPYGNLCYSLSDEKRLSNVYLKHCLNVLFIEEIRHNDNEYKKFINYCNGLNLPIRFNNDGDFNGLKDIDFLNRVAIDTHNKIGGYTKRTDLISDDILNGINFYLQISDKNYITTTNIKEYLNNNNKCNSYCNHCLKCYTTYKPKITLLHGSLSKIDKHFNTVENRELLINFFDKQGLKLTHNILTKNKGLLSSLNIVFEPFIKERIGIELKFNNFSDLVEYLTAGGF